MLLFEECIGTSSNLLRNDGTFPVITDEGDLFLILILVSKPVLSLKDKLGSIGDIE